MSVRRAVPGDEVVLRQVRLGAVADAPSAFATDLERERARTPEDWRRWLSPGATLLWQEGGSPAQGLVAGVIDGGGSAHLAALWVHPDRRGRGVGDALVAGLVGWAHGERRRLSLQVVASNEHARHLYDRHGFVVVGDPAIGTSGALEVAMEHRGTVPLPRGR